jgi:hypothetical protein
VQAISEKDMLWLDEIEDGLVRSMAIREKVNA